MADVQLNAVLEGVRGKVGEIVFKRYGDRIVLTRKPIVRQPNTPAQLAAREKFRRASLAARAALMDPAVKGSYEERAKQKGVTAFVLMVSDLMRRL